MHEQQWKIKRIWSGGKKTDEWIAKGWVEIRAIVDASVMQKHIDTLEVGPRIGPPLTIFSIQREPGKTIISWEHTL